MPVPTPLTPTTAGPADSTTASTAWAEASRSWTSETIWSVVPSAGRLKQLPIMGGSETAPFHQADHRLQPVAGRRKPGELHPRRRHPLARGVFGPGQLQRAAPEPDARAHPERS